MSENEVTERTKLTTDLNYKQTYVWRNIILYAILHMAAIYGLYLALTFKLKLLTYVWTAFLIFFAEVGIVLGAHRFFSHNSFKLTTPGQILFTILHSLSGQGSIYWWARDHRIHHKFVDTDADPYNIRRGFFFAHMGWLLVKKHPLVVEKGKTIDMSDLEANKLVMFQKRYLIPMFVVIGIIIPTYVPVFFWKENPWIAFYTSFAYRLVQSLHNTWVINSIAHTFGTKPFDMRITARQSNISNLLSFGEGYHNYHHVFPWDHSASELGYKSSISTKFLYFLQSIGIAYDLKKPSESLIYKHYSKHGDGTLYKKDDIHVD